MKTMTYNIYNEKLHVSFLRRYTVKQLLLQIPLFSINLFFGLGYSHFHYFDITELHCLVIANMIWEKRENSCSIRKHIVYVSNRHTHYSQKPDYTITTKPYTYKTGDSNIHPIILHAAQNLCNTKSTWVSTTYILAGLLCLLNSGNQTLCKGWTTFC